MAIKVDMAKAYDMVDWSFLKYVMVCLDFSNHFIALILECISTHTILLNGSLMVGLIPLEAYNEGTLCPRHFLLSCSLWVICKS